MTASGLPQPGDFILLGWAVLMALTSRIVFPRQFVTIWALLIIYIAAVSLLWALILSDASILRNVLFYIFNFSIGVALFSLIHAEKAKAKKVLRVALYASLMTSLIFLGLNFNSGAARQVGGFNNPNQLGFYSLLQFCTLTILYSRQERLPVHAWVTGIATVLLTLLSSSLVAAAGIGVAVIGFMIRFRLAVRPISIAIGATIVLLSGWLLMQSGFTTQLINQWESRMNAAGRKLEGSVEQRGFHRLLEYPEHLIFGAAEGARYRFGVEANEIHSGPLTILFSYGLPGFILLLALFWLLFRRATFSEWIVLLAPLVYMSTHQGLRTTMFWMFVVIAYSYMDNRSQSDATIVARNA